MQHGLAHAAEAKHGLRHAIVAAGKAMVASGLSPGRSGNVSARCGAGMLITPTGLPFAALAAADIVRLDEAGAAAADALRPSSEWALHAAIYRARPDMHAIVHCHSAAATALACAGLPIPAFHYMIAVAGGDCVPLAPYALFGTPELAALAAAALARHRACLLAHHGQVALGVTLAAACELAETVEWLADMYLRLLPLGAPRLLGAAEMAAVHARFAGYGQQNYG